MGSQREYGGEPIPGYKLIERLGGGGFGEVWKCEAPGGMLKAIKFVYGDLQTSGEEGHRAEQELKALNRVKTVRHPYILSLERYDIVDGQLMIIMELADKNLWDRFRECRAQGHTGIPREELMRYMEESAEALDLMNIQYQLQHLDIKPQNIFLVYNHIKVADFGLVKDLEGMVASVTGGVTPVYAAPETFDGMVTRFCDQYSLAIVYQELLTGQRPFSGTNIHQLVMQHVSGKPNLSPLPQADQEVIARALNKNPDERFPNCAEMVRALRAQDVAAAAARSAEVVALSAAPAVPEGEVRTPGRDTRAGGGPGTVTVPPMAPMRPLSAMEAPRAVERANAAPVVDKAPAPPPVEEPQRPAPPEVTGDGELFPAVVIGLGQMGMAILEHLRQTLKERFGSGGALPHLRLLAIDTDPEALHELASGGRTPALTASEVLTAKLNRALHYQKPREGRPRLDTWFNTNLLYRIQRNLTTGGLRPLGRLAFIDNYRAIAQRLNAELEASLDPDNLASAVKQTGLSLRTNRPRVYIVSSLTGGTGSGMFLDLAYVVRRQLKELGYREPDVVGLLLIPALEKNAAQKKAVVNAYAALTELHHFSASGTTFTARFDDREGNVSDPQPPFRHCLFLPLAKESDLAAGAKVIGMAGDFLYRDLATPLGRAADSGRAAVKPHPDAPIGQWTCQTFGLTRFWWPRRAVLQRASRRFCQYLVQNWIARESAPPPELIQNWVQDQWASKELAPELQIARLQAACERDLGQSPEVAFAVLTEPFVPKGWFGLQLDADVVRDAIGKIEKWLGQPGASSVLYRPGLLEETLRKEAGSLSSHWDQQLLQVTGHLLEQPEFRLAGAEDAIRQIIALIDETLKHQEPLFKELGVSSGKGYERLQFLLQNLDQIIQGGRKTSQFATELIELLKVYPKQRYQSMVLKVVNNTYTSVRGRLSDQLREVNSSRGRLGDLLRALENPGTSERSPSEVAPGYQLLPVGCRTLDDAVNLFVNGMKPEDLEELNKRMHNLIRQQFRGLVNVCNSPASILKNLEAAMVEEAINFAATQLTGNDVVEMYLGHHEQEQDAKHALAKAFDAAMPALIGNNNSSGGEVCILAAPAGPHEARLRDLARQAVPELELLPAASADDIVFYREETRLALKNLEQVGPVGQEAYQQSNAENFSPHTRSDIGDWKPVVT